MVVVRSRSNRCHAGQAIVVDVERPGSRRDYDDVAPARGTRCRASSSSGVAVIERGGELDDGFLAFAENEDVGLRVRQAELGHRGDVLAAEHDRNVGTCALDHLDQPHGRRPLVREDER